VADGSDLDARQRMLEASYLAGLAMNNAGLGGVHGISHAISGLYDTPHGSTNALLLPEVIRLNARRSADVRAAFTELVGESDAVGPRLATQVETLLEAVGLSDSLPGLPDNPSWDRVAASAVAGHNIRANPVAFSEADVRALCERVFEVAAP